MPEELALDSFYQKYCAADGGLPVLTSESVSDQALTTAAALVARVLGDRPLIREPLIAVGARITLIGEHEHLPQVPEAADVMPEGRDPEALRGIALPDDPVVAVASEENVLCWPTAGEESYRASTLLHELAHIIHIVGLQGAQREGASFTFQEEVTHAYEEAMDNGLWMDTYAATNEYEYWAEGVGLYFASPAGPTFTGRQVGVEDREALRDYDPPLFSLLHWVFGDDDWYPACPKRKRAPLAGKSCAEAYSGEEVVSFATPLLQHGTSVSGTVYLPKALRRASAVAMWVRGSSDEHDRVSAIDGATMQLAPGTRDFRYTIPNVPPGEYLFKVIVDADDTGFEPGTFWTGTYSVMGEGDHTDVARVGTTPRCDVDVTLYTPAELERSDPSTP